ncbi:MAG TPA: hypothetical protein VMT72_02455 [Pseudolabrys sp.]|nr:hypothetical protein [Pseudolabrys sp.]
MEILMEAARPKHIGDDILVGARQIAVFLFNNGDDKHRRKVFYLVSKRRIPVFRPSSGMWARKSALLAYIEEQERKSLR